MSHSAEDRWNGVVAEGKRRQSERALESGGGGGDSGGMEARVAVLEQIAKTTLETLKEIKDELRALRTDVNGRIDKVDDRMRAETKWLLITMASMFVFLAGIMAKGFKWF